MDLEQCGCVDQGNRRQYLVEARVDEDQLGEFLSFIVDEERGGIGGGGGYDPVRVDGLCVEKDSRRVVFCAEDRDDYRTLEEQFPEISFRATSIN